MGSAIERLLKLATAEDRYDIPYEELLPVQLEAANERLASRREAIPLLKNRAESAGLTAIGEAADLVPLLFAHTAYKSYAEGWLTEGRWDRMGKWLATVSTKPVEGVDLDGVADIDVWLKRMEPAGHFVTCSSGTTGKPAMLSCSRADLDVSGVNNVQAFGWATDVKPKGDRKMFGLGPMSNIVRNEVIRTAMVESFSSWDNLYQLPGEPITVGQVSAMVALRRRIADGSALPNEVAAFENLSKSRQASVDGALEAAIEELIASRGQKLLITGMWANLYKICQGIRERGYGAKDFQADNAMLVGGGLKGAVLPPDYKEFVLETFNAQPQRLYHLYSMQELNTPFPMCGAGRYHVAPWVMLLPLDQPGETLLDASGGEIEGRAAFFDISLDGRWGGVISGDKITASFGKCACGQRGPTVGPEIARYSDLAGGDKISCSGTIDAYVRGEA
ncbi:hypothetical protein LJR219_004277 [Phenylobacterium sp. LjRoot219]|uniref:hypothetical protein n=1 Tax=Phenylobacterium sp. LjRoot219 TaxID=3342283 RepID=UPI003ECFB638